MKVMEGLRGQGKGFGFALDVMGSYQRVSNQATDMV